MAGFAARTSASQGIERPLHAKALALEDARGRRVVLVTLDLLGLTTGVGARIAEAARRRYGLSREQLLLNASHTHCGPVIDEMLAVAYDLSDAQWRDVREYTRELENKVVRVIGAAMKRGEPAELRAAPAKDWHASIGDPNLADVICDRVLNNAHRIEMKGPSMRRTKGDPKSTSETKA